MPSRGPVVEVVIRARDLASTVVGRFRRTLRTLTRTVRDVTRAVVGFTAAAGALLLGLTKLGQQGSKVLAVKRAFARITDDETAALERLRRASGGTIDDFALMSLHNQALALGAARTSDEFARMIELSRALGRAQGIEATDALQKLTIGMARQSRLRLDDLGIVITQTEANERYAGSLGRTAESLTEAEKKTAFMNETLRQAEELVVRLGVSTDQGAEASNRFATTMTNLRNRLSEVAAESPLVASLFDQLEGLASDVIDVLGGDRDLMVEAFRSLGRMFGNALSLGFAETAQGVRGVLNDIVRGTADAISKRLPGHEARVGMRAEKDSAIAEQFPGRGEDTPGFLEDLSEQARENLAAEREAFAAIARAASALASARADTARTQSQVAAQPPGVAIPGVGRATLGRPSFVQPWRPVVPREEEPFGLPFGTSDIRSMSLANARRQLEANQIADAAAKHAEQVEMAGELVTTGLFEVAAGIARGGDQLVVSLISTASSLSQSLLGGLAGAVFGGAGTLAMALIQRSKRPAPVRVEDYGPRAIDQQRSVFDERPQHITVQLLDQRGNVVSTLQQIRRMESRDGVTRLPVTAAP